MLSHGVLSLSSLLGPQTLGWAAAVLTLLTFVSADMRRLRLLALGANAAFIAYGSMVDLLPVMALHLALVPVNLWRLHQAYRHPGRPARVPARPAPAAGRQPGGWSPRRQGAHGGRRAQAGKIRVRTDASDPPAGRGSRTTALDLP